MTSPGGGINLQLILDTARAQAQLRRDMERAGRQAGQGASDAFDGAFRPRNIAQTLLPAAGASLVIGGFGKIIKSAQAYEQALNATTQVYGDMSGEITKFVDVQSRALGLAKGDAQDYANQFGAIFIGLGKSQEAAAEFSQTLTKAGAALAAFRNTSVDQAIQALQAGFRGEYDGLQRFIPQVSDLTLTNKALAMGLAETRSEVDQQDKAMALLNIVQGSVANSAGQAELAHGNLQTRLAQTQAQAKDNATTFGRLLIPALEGTLDVVNAVGPATLLLGAGVLLLGRRFQSSAASSVGFIGGMRASASSSFALSTALARQQAQFSSLTVTQAIANRSAITANNQVIASSSATQASLTGLGAAWGRLAGQMAAAATTGSAAARTLGVASIAARGVGTGLAAGVSALGGPVTLALTAATIGVGYFLTQQAKQREESRRAAADNKTYAESLEEIGDKSSEAARQLAAKQVVDKGLAAQADRNMISVGLLTTAYTGQQEAIELINKRINDRITKLRAERAAIVNAEGPSAERAIKIKEEIADLTDLEGKVNSNAEAINKAANKQDLYNEALGITAPAINYVTDAYTVGKKAIDSYRTAEEFLTKGRLDALDANIAYESAIDATTEAITKNGTTLDITTAKGRDNVANVRDIISAAYDQAEADIEATGSISANTQRRIDGLRSELTQMGFNKAEIDVLLAKYKTVPPEVTTQIKVLGGVDAEGELTKIGRAAVQMIAQYNLTPVQAMGLAQGRDPRAVFGQPRAYGGPILGQHVGDRADNVTARVTPGEWVIQRPAVRALESEFGPNAMPAINAGRLPTYATGGMVADHKAVPKSWQSWGQLLTRAKELEAKKKQELAASMGGGTWDGTVAPGALGAMQQWALSKQGGRYQWAGVGPGGMDCSGMVGNLWAIATGNPLYRRYFTTHNMGPGRFGMQSGPGNFTVYLKQGGGGGGHTAANVGGLHVESYGGNGTPYAIGRVGTRLSYYDQVMHLAGLARGGKVLAPSDPGSTQKEQIQSFLQRGWPEPPATTPTAGNDWLMDRGGMLNPGDTGTNLGRHPEAVLDAEETAGFKGLTRGDVAFRLDNYTLARLAQIVGSRPVQIVVDGSVIAETAFNNVNLR